jgi:DNA-binding CsgD family transcriptional regulator/tetratricopeptide (TPR) repeat protein
VNSVGRARSSESSLGRLSSPVLVGRMRELELLLEAVARPPALVVVEGEAGVGKTRLVEELLARPELADRARYVGHCEQLSEPFPLGPVVEALRRAAPDRRRLTPVAGALRPLLPELSAHLPGAPAPLGDRRAERHRLFRAVRELLGALGPALLVLEDLHWADDGTLELVRFLGRQLAPDLLLLCTYRSEEFRDGSPRPAAEVDVVHVALRPLETGHVRSLAGTILATDDVSDEFADYLSARSGGIPFAVEEILRLLRDRRDLVRRCGVWVRRELAEVDLPSALGESIRERLGRLSPAAQRAVQVAAVLSGPCNEELLLDVARLRGDLASGALAEALGSGLLLEVGERRYGFRHVLARDAIEAGIPSPLCRRMHLRAARALEAAQPQLLVRLAHHYRAAGRTAQWLRYAEAAADGAESLEDDATAYVLLEAALGVDGLPAATRGRLAVKLAAHALQGLVHTEAIAALQRLIDDETLPRERRGEMRVWLARLFQQVGEGSAAHVEAVRALEDLDRQPAVAAEAMARLLARPWDNTRGVGEHLRWLGRATELATRSGDRATRAIVAENRAITLLSLGQPAWREAIEELPERGTTADDVQQAVLACNNLASAALEVGRYERARALLREGFELSARLDHARPITFLRLTELETDWVVGNWDGLRGRASCFAVEMEDWPGCRVHAQAVLGLVILAAGDVRAARRLLEQLAADYHGQLSVFTWVTAGLARINLAEARAAAAVEVAARGLEPIRQKGAWMWAIDAAPVSVEALLAGGRCGEALALTNQFAHGLRGFDAPGACAALAVCRALVAEADGQPQRAARVFQAAERAWRALPRPIEAARAREGAGRCLLVAGEERGQELLVEAMEALQGLGATWDAARVRSTLRKHGAEPPTRRGRKGYGDELSPREIEVVRLAAAGMTNREIASRLFVAIVTVEQHLRSARRKLGVRSREELSERLDPVVAN